MNMKPKHPCSIYNLFFQLERECMIFDLNQYENKGNGPSSHAGDNTLLVSKNVHQRPMRYRHLVLADDWYKSGRSKRKHRKSNLPFGFKQLNDIISKRWESVDEETKEYLKKIVAAEWKVYKAEKKKLIKEAADKIKSNHTTGWETNVSGHDQGGLIRAGKMYDSTHKQVGPSMSMTWICKKLNNYSSNIMPPNASPNLSVKARRSPHLPLRDCRENEDVNIHIQNGNTFGNCAEFRFSSQIGSFSTANHNETFSVGNNVKNGSYENSSILDVGAKTTTESWLDMTTMPEHDSFKSCKEPPAIFLDSTNYLPKPNSKPTRSVVQTPHFHHFASDRKTSFSDYNIYRGDTVRMMSPSTPAHCQKPNDSTCYSECPCNDVDAMIPDSRSAACFHPVKETSPTTRTSFNGVTSSGSIDFHGCLHHEDNANYNEVKNFELADSNDEDKFFGANSEFYVSESSSTSFHTVDKTSLAINGDHSSRPIDFHSSRPFIARFHPVDETAIATCCNPSSDLIEFHFTIT